MEKWKKIAPTLDFIAKLAPSQRKQFLRTAKSDIIRLLTNFVYNLVTANHLPLTKEIIDRLRPFKKQLLLASTKNISLLKRKKIFILSDCLGKVLNILIPFLNKVLFLQEKHG